MIRIGSNRIGRALVKDINVNGIYLGPKLVWGREVELLQMFKASVLADGGIYDEELFTTEFFRQSALVRSEAVVLIVCGAYKAGIIYGINCITGKAVPFTFERTSVGTYIDKYGKLQTVGANIPRINYDPVTLSLRGYLGENGSTALITNSLLDGNTAGWNVPTSINITYNTGASSYGRRFVSCAKANISTNAAFTSSTGISSANTIYAARVTLRAGASNKVAVGIGADSDPAAPGVWGTNDNSGIRKIAGPGTVSRFSTGVLAKVEGLSETEDTVIEVWRRYVTAGIPLRMYFYPGLPDSTTIGDSVKLSSPQLEANALGVCTSQIDTSVGQVTRAGDTLVSQTDLIQDTEGTILIEGSQLGGYSNNTMLIRGGTGRLWYHDVNPVFLYMWDGTTLLNRNAYYSNGLKAKVAGSWKAGGQMKLGINGSPLQSGPYDGSFGSPGNITIAGAHSGKIQSHIRSFAIIHRQLSDAEHIALTT